MQVAALQTEFEKIFNRDNGQAFFAPGRINLIGEHTDYNGGRVFPCAITHGTYGIAAKREDRTIRCYSMNFAETGIIETNLDSLQYQKADSWANFVKGVIHFLQAGGHSIDSGFDLLVYGNIPNGAGLSSSASLELLVGVIAESLYHLDVTRLDLIKIGKQTENEFIGVNSGIMDQFAIGMGAKNMALYLDTNSLAYELVPADFGKYVILIMNTNKRRELADSKYNERRSQCETALKRLQTSLSIQSLGELSPSEFEASRHLINDPTLERRAKHAVYENERTAQAKAALTAGDLVTFGQLLNQSHISLRDDYDVTGIELDTLVETAWQQPGVLGARMTGAGMGGCAIALVTKAQLEAVRDAIATHYETIIGYPASFYVAEVGDGARAL